MLFDDLLVRLARKLESLNVPYMVIGGQAVLRYGEPRFTQDVDVTISAPIERLSEIVEAVEDCGLQPLVDPQTFTPTTLLLPLEETSSHIRVDLIFGLTGFEERAIAGAGELLVDGYPVRFISVEDLLVQKIFAGRPRDLEDARSILLRNRSLDLEQVASLLADFEADLGEPFLARLETLVASLERDSS